MRALEFRIACGAGGFGDGDELVAGGEDGDFGFGEDFYPGCADARGDGEGGGVER